jgi:DNA-binding transcriptional ArsR family regulator
MPLVERKVSVPGRCAQRSSRVTGSRLVRAILSRVVKSQSLDRAFSALSDPTRRDILERLGSGPATLTELAHPLNMTLPGVLKHVRVLEGAPLVTTQRIGRTRECRLGPDGLDDASQWIATHRLRWERRLDRLEDFIEKTRRGAT